MPEVTDQVPFGAVEFADNPEPRCPCLLLLDTSGSMQGDPIKQLNEGLVAFKDELAADTLAAKRVEVCIIFSTDPAAKDHLQFDAIHRRVTELALFTDGLQRLALHYASNMVHLPFFRALFPEMRHADPGHVEALSNSLAAFLRSDRVNERTDDDKTLILASRVRPDRL